MGNSQEGKLNMDRRSFFKLGGIAAGAAAFAGGSFAASPSQAFAEDENGEVIINVPYAVLQASFMAKEAPKPPPISKISVS